MLRLPGRSRAALLTALIATVVAVEVWALSLPLLTEIPVGLPAGWNARDFSILFDLILVLPLLAVALIYVWSRPAATGRGIAVPGWLRPWIRPRRLLYLLVPPLLANLARLELGLGEVVAGVAALAVISEVVAFALASVILVRMVRATRAARAEGYTLSTAVMVAAGRALPVSPLVPALRMALLEITQLYYLTVGWFRPARHPVGRGAARTFTYHRRRDETLFLGLIIFVAIEAVPVHVVVNQYSQLAAWILTALHVYSLLWLLGPLVAVRRRPYVLSEDRLRLVDGLWHEAVIELNDVLSVTDLRWIEEGEEAPKADAAFGDRAQILLELRSPTTVYGLFGGSKEARTIGVEADDADALLEALTAPRRSHEATAP